MRWLLEHNDDDFRDENCYRRVLAWLAIALTLFAAGLCLLFVRSGSVSLLAAGFAGVLFALPAVAFVAMAIKLVGMTLRRNPPRNSTKCYGCGYDLRNLREADRCPECGRGFNPNRVVSGGSVAPEHSGLGESANSRSERES